MAVSTWTRPRACVCARVRACMCVCVRACMRARGCVHASATVSTTTMTTMTILWWRRVNGINTWFTFTMLVSFVFKTKAYSSHTLSTVPSSLNTLAEQQPGRPAVGPRVELKQEPVSSSSDESAVERWDHRSRCALDRLRRSIRFHRICVFLFLFVRKKQRATAKSCRTKVADWQDIGVEKFTPWLVSKMGAHGQKSVKFWGQVYADRAPIVV